MSAYQDGRVVAITGAGRGLGLLTVELLLDRGVTVIANHRSPSADLDLLAGKYGDQLVPVAGDIGAEKTAEAIAAAARELGGLHALVHNAAISRDGALVRMSTADWDEVQRVNLRGGFLATKHALRVMMPKRYGRIVYVSSVSATRGNAGQGNYAASKAGLHGLSMSVAQEYAGHGIRTVVVAPGVLDIGLSAAMKQEIQQMKIDRTLLGLGDSRSTAETIAFLSGAGADFINATVLYADGGLRF
jgi:3-oxoacyl-[acyl-carrier protein] reductase